MNAKEELLKHIKNREVKYIHLVCEFEDEKSTIEGSLDEVLPKLDFEYDNSFGIQYLNGTIWYSNGTWSERGEYDGSEWWEYRECPPLPNNDTKPTQSNS